MSNDPEPRFRASDPGGVTLSLERLDRLWPRGSALAVRFSRLFKGPDDCERAFDAHLRGGDSRAALVLTTAPLRVAVFTDELDCVALVRYPDRLVKDHDLVPGSRLLTVNQYIQGDTIAPDLVPGPKRFDRFVNFHPLLADFLSDDVERIAARKREISEEEWERCRVMGETYLGRQNLRCREGSPYRSWKPA